MRADSGFAREEIMAWCEDNGVYYCLGLARNKRLSARLGKCFGELHRGIQSGEIQVPCRRFEDFEYRTRKSWSRARRVVGKAEILDKGPNPRFVVTNLPAQGAPRTGRALAAWRPAEGLPGEPEERFAAPALYEKLYCARGEMENRIKEAQQDLFADRTSTSWMASNQLRLWFSAFAHLMVSVLRAEVLRGTDLASATLGQIRLKLFKIGARIKISCRRKHADRPHGWRQPSSRHRGPTALSPGPAGHLSRLPPLLGTPAAASGHCWAFCARSRGGATLSAHPRFGHGSRGHTSRHRKRARRIGWLLWHPGHSGVAGWPSR